MRDSVTVTLPPDPAFLHILRQVTGGVASQLRLTVDDIDDLRLAVDEAASYLLTGFSALAALCLTLEPTATALRVTVSADTRVETWPDPGLLESLPWKVIAGLVAEAKTERDAMGRPGIVLVKYTLDADR